MSIFRKIADWRFSRRVYRFGVGEVCIAHGDLDGKPCVGICRPDKAGEMGQDATEYWDKMMREGVVLVFENGAGADNFIRTIAKAAARGAKKGGAQ